MISKNNIETFSKILTDSLTNTKHLCKNITFPYKGLLYFDEVNKQLVTYTKEEKINNLYISGLYFDVGVRKNKYNNENDILKYITECYLKELYSITLSNHIFYFDLDGAESAFESDDESLLQPNLGVHFSVKFFDEILNKYIYNNIKNDGVWFNDYDYSNKLFSSVIPYLLKQNPNSYQMIDYYLYTFVLQHADNNKISTEFINENYNDFFKHMKILEEKMRNSSIYIKQYEHNQMIKNNLNEF